MMRIVIILLKRLKMIISINQVSLVYKPYVKVCLYNQDMQNILEILELKIQNLAKNLNAKTLYVLEIMKYIP